MRLFWPLTMLFLVTALFAQELPGGEGVDEEEVPAAGPFPLALVLDEAEFFNDKINWQPDWPLEMPVDAFRSGSNNWLSITVAFGDVQYSLRRDNSKLLEFPFMIEGSFIQVRFEYGSGDIEKDLLKFIYLDENAKLEVLEYFDGRPSLIRVFREGVYSFVLLRYGTATVSESWFDQDGVFLERTEYRRSFGYERITWYKCFSTQEECIINFDSRYLVTEIRGKDGVFSVHYLNEDLPRYWNRQLPEAESLFYSLQWDMNGLLVRLWEEQSSGGSDSRYEYVFDSRGNWIERREIKMIASNGLLIPAPGVTVRRVIEYGENDE